MTQNATQAYALEVEAAVKKLEEDLLKWQSKERPSPLIKFPLRALTWLALAPAWPMDLAERGFPLNGPGLVSGQPVIDQLNEFAAAQICESGFSDSGSGELFWMNSSQQSELLAFLQKLPNDEVQSLGVRGYIRACLKEASSAMVSAAGKTLTPPLQRWAELAENAGDDESITKRLRSRVGEALADAKAQGQIICPEALRWIEAARPFVGWLGPRMEWAVEQSGSRLELFYREAYDGRSLKNYFIRIYQEQAFTDLIEGKDLTASHDRDSNPDSFWALHYVGLGGTGKTMLMRRISSQLAEPMGLAVARVDFDRLDPDYPSRAPGRLLMGFAEELRLRATENIFERFDNEVDTLHDSIREGNENALPLNVLVDDPAFQRVLTPFIDAVRQLSAQKRVVLILDTCEELAKMRSDGTLPDSVRVTFDILERIHSKVESLRVVFSGRRPLAQAGQVIGREGLVKKHKWTCPVSHLPERDYLRLYEIRGFAKGEAGDFLEDYKGEKDARVPSDLIEPIINQSLSADKSFDSRFDWHDDRLKVDTDPRYNPYDLDMFAEWTSGDPKVGQAEIAKGATAYVKDRIIKRATAKIRKVLPEIVLLSRFDEKMIQELLELKDRNFEIVFEELISQEWLDVDRNATQAGTVWAMDSIMRKRLLKYYQTEDQSTFNKATKRIAEFLSRLTLERDWKELSVAYFESALGALLLYDRRKAAKWWEEVEKKLARDANWIWAKELTDQLLDEGLAARADASLGDQVEVEAECVLRPAICATQAAAHTHLLFSSSAVSREGLLGIWSEVLEKAERHPTPEGVLRLTYRAIAGKAAAYRWQYDLHAPPLLDTLVELFELLPRTADLNDESSAASEMAMLEGLLEICESLSLEYDLANDPQFLRKLESVYCRYYDVNPIWWSYSLPNDVQAFYRTLIGRLQHLCGLLKEERIFHSALENPHAPDYGTSVQRHLDWHHPEDLRARVMLEFIRTTYPAYSRPEDILEQLEKHQALPGRPPAALTTMDGDRLASAKLLLGAYSGLPPLPTDAVYPHEGAIDNSVLRQVSAPDCNAHRTFPPFFATALETRFTAGSVDQAVEQVAEISKRAENSRPQLLHVQKTADRSLIRMAARLHLRDEKLVIGSSLNDSKLLSDLSLRFYLNALDGPKATETIETYLQRETDWKRRATMIHIGWRSGKTDMSTDSLAELMNHDPSARFMEFALALDAVESVDLGNQHTDVRRIPEILKTCSLVGEWARGHVRQPIEALTLCLRARALDSASSIDQLFLDAFASKVGTSRAASIAFEEGTLLALKLPQRGLELLWQAHRWYSLRNDWLKQFLTTVSISVLQACLQDREALGLSLLAVEREYPAQTVEALPRWNVLVEVANQTNDILASDRIKSILDELDSSRNWRPTVVRVLGCLIRQQEFSSPGNKIKALQEWIEEKYSTAGQNRSYIPPDLSYLLSYGDTPTIQAPAASDAPLSKRRSVFRTILWVTIGVGFSFLGLAILTYGVHRAVSYVYPLSRGVSFIIVCLLLVLLSRISAIWRWFTSTAITMWKRSFHVRSDGAIEDVNHPLLSPLQLRAQMGPAVAETTLAALESAREDTYRQLTRAVPEQIRIAWARANTYAGKLFLATKLTVDPDTAAAPWEAILGVPAEKIRRFDESRLICWRDLKIRDVARLGPLAPPLKVVTLESNVAQADMAQRSWTTLSPSEEGKGQIDPAEFSYSIEKFGIYFSGSQQKGRVAPNVDILHLIGKPRQTNAGLRLELSGADSPYDTGALPGTVPESQKSSSSPRIRSNRTYLLQAGEINASFPNLRICLVQSEPSIDEGRSASVRFEAGLLRRFGAELFMCGIPAIVLVPPLKEAVAIEVIRVMQQMVTTEAGRGRRRWWHDRTPLLKTIRTMQDIIGRSYDDPETALESAFDLCLYKVERFDLEVRPNFTAGRVLDLGLTGSQ